MSKEHGKSQKPEAEELKDSFHSFTSPVEANGKFAEILDGSAYPTERKRVDEILTGHARSFDGLRRRSKIVDQRMTSVSKAVSEAKAVQKDLSLAKTFGEYGIVAIHQVGTMINYTKRLGEFQRAVNNNSTPQELPHKEEYFELSSFDKAAVLDMKIGPITLQDFVNQDKKQQLPTASILSYFMEGRRIFKESNPIECLQDSDSKYAKEYPSYGLYHLSAAIDAQSVMTNFAYRDDLPDFQAAQRKYPQAAPHVKDIMKKVRNFHDRFIETVLDPDAEEFEDVQKTVQKYLKMPVWYRHHLVNVMSMGMLEGVQLLYRKAEKVKEEEKGEPYKEFYADFMNTLRDYADGKSLRTGMYNSDDLEEIFTPDESQEVKLELTVDDLRKKVAEIIPFAPKQQYELDIDAIQWGEVTPPQDAEIEFARGKPMEFWVKLFYESDAEEQEVLWYVEAKKGEFDWNFIEDVDDAKMVGYKHASMRAIANILEKVREKAAEDKKLRQEEKLAKTSPVPMVVFSPKNKKSGPPVMEEEDGSKKRKRKREVAMEGAMEEKEYSETEESVRRNIVIPDDDTLAALMKKLSPDEIGKVKKGIEEFNERGIGQFKLLFTGGNNPRAYSLRVNTGSKGIRVLLQEGESEGTQRNFEILDIKRRKDIYRKNGL